ncbi:unnamed protein product [Rotaria sp. Silwood2]|nr:unnamed protein product [Rotaria sp. Silwood2]CAF3048226.1 unnamed protein product [Rotaria sp. Silwood2]CAF3305424.1 unnamed protein product [Rotaria sp. Silwood2]CAF3392483.1 unnamed protein product [Rotaria sp. Silwood2]CAF4254571.1 unnamed protein product [Rotaria sp. Silwood2]
MNKTVTKISKNKRNSKWIVTTAESSDEYDAVILTTPPHHSNIILSDIRDQIIKVDYVQQHVTLFTTNATHLGSSYMNMPIPVSLFITRYLERQNGTHDLNLDVEVMRFSELLYPHKERLVKLFSPTYLDDSKLAKIVDGKANIGWMHRKMWYAYPRSPPNNNTIFPPINPDERFYYANGFENFISTMETQCLAAHNIVRLLLIDFDYDEKAATLADDYWIDEAK